MVRNEVAQRIIDSLDYVKQMIGFCDHPKRHQFVATGPQVGCRDVTRRIGYCVQVRKGCGQFGSDMVFLRHPDGALSTHENQSYLVMTDEQKQMALEIFECLPHDEANEDGSDPEYTIGGEFGETGFLIIDSKTEPTPNAPFQITIKNSNGDTVSIEQFI